MRREVPVLRRCFGCLPLRYGLIVWGYLKLLTSNYELWTEFHLWWRGTPAYTLSRFIRVFQVLDCIVAFVTILLTIVFIIGCYKKNAKILRYYYLYTLSIIAPMLVIHVTYTADFLLNVYEYVSLSGSIPLIHYTLTYFMFTIGDFILQVYFILLIRSEFMKLQNGMQFEFVNLDAEAECKLQINNIADVEKDQETGKKT